MAATSPGQVVTIFRSRLRDGIDEEYPAMAAEMLELARTMPGFVDFKSFESEDGERVSLITFDGPQSQRAWRDHPHHRDAQQTGRNRFYEEYTIVVCTCVEARAFRSDGR